ncbi:hypothetical protein NDU88_001971 [Pleurodeles waltl]|uniref:Uncharacterized protein n=1 Tax=Pleurodeles waltl TaxID=8319 RepID=A0AAV7V9V4_PLEWA|nr:hypothetical protein NDU88_001971 [Pleurodeles waltl]
MSINGSHLQVAVGDEMCSGWTAKLGSRAEAHELGLEKLQFLFPAWQGFESAFNISEMMVELCDPVLEAGYVHPD